MCGCSSGGRMPCAACKIIRLIVSILLLLTTIAAFLGVWNTHMTPAGWVFGSIPGSVALATFVLSLIGWFKVAKKMCPCNYRCGSGCAGGCGCGMKGCDCGKGSCTCGSPNCPECSKNGKMNQMHDKKMQM